MLTVFQVCKILQVATKSNRISEIELEKPLQCVTLEGWTEILYWVSCSSPPPSHHHQHLLSTKAPFELRISLFFFCLFLFLFFVLFLCPEPCVWWLGAGHQRVCLALDLLLLPRPPRRLLYHEPHPRHTLWVRQN